jgi:hypothetical protein
MINSITYETIPWQSLDCNYHLAYHKVTNSDVTNDHCHVIKNEM